MVHTVWSIRNKLYPFQANNMSQNEYSTFYGDYENEEDEGDKYIKFQPFSLFFLLFYIILIITQFICMLWHRYHSSNE